MATNLFGNRTFRCLIFSTMIFAQLFTILLFQPNKVSAAGDSFPAEPFNGMQITYSISGANITASEDTEGFTTSRVLRGELGTGQLIITGSAKMGNGYYADVKATVSCGEKTDEFTTKILSGFPDFNEESFQISVPIPEGAAQGSFSINMVGDYNAGNRWLDVSGTFTAEGTEDEGTSEQPDIDRGEDPPPGPLTDKLPDYGGQKTHRGYIEKIEGKPIYISADPITLPPSERKWVKFMPGEKNILLFGDWTIRTPSGAKIVAKWTTGARYEMKERSWLDVVPWASQHPPTEIVFTRLIEGVINYYYPKGEEGARKHEIALRRAIVGIKGTNFVAEVNQEMDLIKVIEGTVEVTAVGTDEKATLAPGEQISVTDYGLASISSFDIAKEKLKWESFYQELEGADSSIFLLLLLIIVPLLSAVIILLLLVLKKRKKAALQLQSSQGMPAYYQGASRFCAACGYPLSANSRFCARCGRQQY